MLKKVVLFLTLLSLSLAALQTYAHFYQHNNLDSTIRTIYSLGLLSVGDNIKVEIGFPKASLTPGTQKFRAKIRSSGYTYPFGDFGV